MSKGCLCEEPLSNHEEMIGCDGSCQRWYHYSCVGMSQQKVDMMDEEDKWHCPFCVSTMESKQTNETNDDNNKEPIKKLESPKKEEIKEIKNESVNEPKDSKPKKMDSMMVDVKPENNKENHNISNNNNNNNNNNFDIDTVVEDVDTGVESKEDDDQEMIEVSESLEKDLKIKLKSSKRKIKKKLSVSERMQQRLNNQNSAKKKVKFSKNTKNNDDDDKEMKTEENSDPDKNSILKKGDEYIRDLFDFTKNNKKDQNGQIIENSESVTFSEDKMVRHLIPCGFMNDIDSLELYESHKQYSETLKEVLEYSALIDAFKRSTDPEIQKRDQIAINNCFKNTWTCPVDSTPIRCDVRKFNFGSLLRNQLKFNNNKLFDIIMMDPPWQLASANPTRGVALGYDQLGDSFIMQIPVKQLQKDGFIFIWIINAKYRFAMELLKAWGYKIIGDIAWVKSTVNFRISRGHGFYLQHGKETCFVAKKGNPDMNRFRLNCTSDAIFSLRRGQSQKPTEIYEFIEHFAPPSHGHTFIEIFGRRNNLRNGWVTLGNEL